MPPPLHRHGDRHSLTLPSASDSDSESRDGPLTDTSVRLGVASTIMMKHALAGTSTSTGIEAQARNSPIRVMPTASGLRVSEVCAVRFEHRSPLAASWSLRPPNPQFSVPPIPIWPGNGEGIPVSGFGRNRETGSRGRRAGNLVV
jgi:hypothetical protein